MEIIPAKERERLLALGVEGFAREIAEGKHCQPTSPYRNAVDDLLRAMRGTEEAKEAARREAIDSESLSIAKDVNSISREANRIAERALANSKTANIWAAIATLIAIIAIAKDRLLALITGQP